MRPSLVALLFLAAASCCSASRLGEYVKTDSVKCKSDGISFTLNRDNSTSALFRDTELNVTLYAGPDMIKVHSEDFDQSNGLVHLKYDAYQDLTLVALATVTGADQRILYYYIEQPFLAVYHETESDQTNYTFNIFCSIPAYYHVNVTRNTKDENNQGSSEGDKVLPSEHVKLDFDNVKGDEVVPLGRLVKYAVAVNDDVYAAVLPLNCKFFDPKRSNQNIPFVLNGCPVPFPDDPDEYFHTMVKKNEKRYEIEFRAFAFGGESVEAQLGIDCDILLCINFDIGNCSKPCWDTRKTTMPVSTTTTGASSESTGTSEASTGTAEGSTSETSTVSTEASSGSTGTSEASTGTAEGSTSEASTGSTEAKTSERSTSSTEASSGSTGTTETSAESTEAGTSEATTPTTEDTTEKTGRKKRSLRYIRSVAESRTYHSTSYLHVGSPTNRNGGPIIEDAPYDAQFMTTLYGIIGALAGLAAVLILVLICFLFRGRGKAVDGDREPVFAANPILPVFSASNGGLTRSS